MTDQDDIQKYRTCSRLLDEGKYQPALTLAESMSNLALRAAIFIDGGFALGKSGIVRQGTEIFERLISSKEDSREFVVYSLLYNAANGRSSLYSLRRRRRRRTIPPNDDDLRSAKKMYRQAIAAVGSEEKTFASRIWVNYGNCLSQLGRYIEAAECYQKAVALDPTNGMAAGNLGIELEFVTRITDRYHHEYIALAHANMTSALGPDMHLKYGSTQAAQEFHRVHARLQQIIDAHKEPLVPPQPASAKRGNQPFKEYVQFCIRKGLFLNAWVGDQEITPAITDEVSFGPILTAVGDNILVPELLRILNEIKEAYSTARYLYYLSQTRKKLLDDISKMTLYFGAEAFELNGAYIGLCKTAYSRAFDILDKVARIINVYFRVGKREDTFWNIFAERRSLGKAHVTSFAARPAICEKNNPCLYALADLCIDYFESEDVDLKTIDRRRNKITHDYLVVKLYKSKQEHDDNDIIALDDLARQTLNVLHLAKYATLYAVSAIAIAEQQKSEVEGDFPSLEYFSNPGQPYL